MVPNNQYLVTNNYLPFITPSYHEKNTFSPPHYNTDQ